MGHDGHAREQPSLAADLAQQRVVHARYTNRICGIEYRDILTILDQSARTGNLQNADDKGASAAA